MLSELSTAVGVLSECCRSAVDRTAGTAVQCCRTAVGLLSDCCRGCCRSVVDCCRPCQSEDMFAWCRSLSICRCCRLSELSTAVDRCRPLSVLSLVSAVDGCPSCCPTQRAPRSMPQPRGALQQLHSGHSCVCQRVDVRNVDLHRRAAQ